MLSRSQGQLMKGYRKRIYEVLSGERWSALYEVKFFLMVVWSRILNCNVAFVTDFAFLSLYYTPVLVSVFIYRFIKFTTTTSHLMDSSCSSDLWDRSYPGNNRDSSTCYSASSTGRNDRAHRTGVSYGKTHLF